MIKRSPPALLRQEQTCIFAPFPLSLPFLAHTRGHLFCYGAGIFLNIGLAYWELFSDRVCWEREHPPISVTCKEQTYHWGQSHAVNVKQEAGYVVWQ